MVGLSVIVTGLLCPEFPITSKHKEKLDLTFIGKGFDVEIGAPFDNLKADILEKTAKLCAEKCPTGALALINNEGI